MILDSKGKLFGKISIIDILIILIVVGGIAGLAYKMHKSNNGSIFTKTESINLLLAADEIPQYAADAVKVGDVVKDKIANTVIGRVTGIATDKPIVYGFDSSGKIQVSSRPGYVSIKLTVKAQGVYTNTGITLGPSDYYVNKVFDIRVGISDFFIKITNMNKVKG